MGFFQKCSQAKVPSILILGAVYVAYVLIGGVVFWKLEGRLVQEDISRILEGKIRLLNTFPCQKQEGLETVSAVSENIVLILNTIKIELEIGEYAYTSSWLCFRMVSYWKSFLFIYKYTFFFNEFTDKLKVRIYCGIE